MGRNGNIIDKRIYDNSKQTWTANLIKTRTFGGLTIKLSFK